MNRLFWKIFLSFWLAMVLIVGLASWINVTMLRTAGLEDFPEGVQQRLVRMAERVAEEVSRNPRVLRPETFRGRRYAPLRVFDERGERLVGRPLPDKFDYLATVTRRVEGGGFVAIPVRDRNGEAFRVVAMTKLPPRVLFGGPRSSLVRLAVAAVISALICWVLARYLTGPIQRLRRASQRLAVGELSARVSDGEHYARDEIGALGRDFDRMAERLQRTRDAQQQLLRDVSHELRSPLSRLMVAAGLARQRADGHATAELDRIEAEAARLEALIEEILTLSRDLADGEPLAAGPIDLAELVRLIIDDANFEAGDAAPRVRLAEPVPDIFVQGELRLLSRAIENVIRNALKYGPDGAPVAVALVREGDDAVLTVDDEGPGVPPGQLERIFEPFHQVDAARGQAAPGHGLGLAIARAAILRHGGSISATNRADGGLRVRLTLPCATASAS
jgi:two-component system sensor histidine kinase CpxA